MNERGSGRDYTINGGAIGGGNYPTNQDAIGGGGAKVGDLVGDVGGVGVLEPAALADNYVTNEGGVVDDDCVAARGDGVNAGGAGGDVGGVEVLEAAAAGTLGARTISPDLPCVFNNYAIKEGAVVVVVGGGGGGGDDDYMDDDSAIINVVGVGDRDDNAFNNAGDHIDAIIDAGNINRDDGGLEVLEDVAADAPAARNMTKSLRMIAFEGTTAILLSLSGALIYVLCR